MHSKGAKPLWGFGWAGLVLLPFALWLLWCFLHGPDLRFKLLELMNNTLGIQAVYWTVLGPLYHNWVALEVAGLGWWGLLYVPVALQIHPRRSRWWSAPLVVWAAVRAEVYTHALIRPGAALSGMLLAASGGLLTRDSAALLLCCLVDVALLIAITRSWFVLTALVAGTAIAIAADQWFTIRPAPVSEWVFRMPAYVWHALAAGSLLAWAIRARRREPRPGFCSGCGYDLRGLEQRRCPECGGPAQPGPDVPQTTQPSGVHSTP